MKITCRSLTEAEFAQALSIRWQVFVGEQNVPQRLNMITMTRKQSILGHLIRIR